MVAQVLMPTSETWWTISVAPEPERLRDAIKRAREARSMTQADVAPLVGMSQNQYGKYETGNSSPSDDLLVQLERIYKLKTDTLFDVQTAHRKWLRTQKPLRGPSIAIPDNDIMRQHLTLLGSLEWDDIAKATSRLASILDNIESEIPARDALTQKEKPG